jgi:hypothetical protein
MKTLLISTETRQKIIQIAKKGGLRAPREVARVYVYLENYQANLTEFWNVRDSASGRLTSSATLRDGTPIWRLCPTHVHCIALLAEQDGDLLVLDVCSRAEIEEAESRLINCC